MSVACGDLKASLEGNSLGLKAVGGLFSFSPALVSHSLL